MPSEPNRIARGRWETAIAASIEAGRRTPLGVCCMAQIAQVIGALLVLAGYAGAQFGALSQRSAAYLLVNAAGSGILGLLALGGRQWGFLLLEGVWALVSLWGLLQLARRRS